MLPRWADHRAHRILEQTGPDLSLSGARIGETDVDSVELHEIVRRCRDAAAYLLGRLVSAATYVALAFVGLLCLASCLIGVGRRLLPVLAPAIKRLGRQERSQAAKRLGLPFDDPADTTGAGEIAGLRPTLRDLAFYRDIVGLTIRSAIGVLAGGLAALIIAGFLNYCTLPILYALGGGGHQVALVGVQLRDWGRVIAVTPLGILICSWLLVRVGPGLANWDARLTLLLLGIPARVELARRVDELTDTRTEALDAHGAELRRIERDLHDGAQARLVSVTMRLGLAERQIARDPQKAAELILSAQSSAEEALAELRDIVRGIYPPVLADRGLDGAVAALAARCAIPTTVGADDIGRAPAAVEAAAYFVVAEALTNVSKHSAAEHAIVRLRKDKQLLIVEVTDDGHGGAAEPLGTGLDGIRRRAAALDGQMQLFSPLGGPTVLRVELPCGS
jgi:signal transduction histidine kinase